MIFDEPAGILVAHATGIFGRLEVRDHDGVRSFWCGCLCQGAFRLTPATKDGAQPGPIPDAPYHLAWLLPARQHPRGSILMAGLGCGAGAVALASCLPDARITVVEIDPAVITLALAHFPALADAVRAGRIEIVRQDILELAWSHRGDPWTFGLLDAFQTGPNSYHPAELLNALHGRCDELWVNVLEVDDILLTAAHTCAELLTDCGWNACAMIPVRDYDGSFTGNVLVGTAAISEHGSHPLPFADIDHLAVLRAREIITRLERLHRLWKPSHESE